MKSVMAFLIMVISFVEVFAGQEYVTLIKILENDDHAIIERKSGERWHIEKGTGALSLWRFEGKQIIIDSPGIFCGVGSQVILPEMSQQARIWNAEQVGHRVVAPLQPKQFINQPSVEQGAIPLTLDQMIPIEQQARMGLSKLSDAEKEELRKFYYGELQKAFQAGQSKASPAIRPAYGGMGSKHWIKRNLDNGTMILLEDGSLWEIDPMDKLNASLWLAISPISVIASKGGSLGYEYLLINTDGGEKAHAKFMGKQ